MAAMIIYWFPCGFVLFFFLMHGVLMQDRKMESKNKEVGSGIWSMRGVTFAGVPLFEVLVVLLTLGMPKRLFQYLELPCTGRGRSGCHRAALRLENGRIRITRITIMTRSLWRRSRAIPQSYQAEDDLRAFLHGFFFLLSSHQTNSMYFAASGIFARDNPNLYESQILESIAGKKKKLSNVCCELGRVRRR